MEENSFGSQQQTSRQVASNKTHESACILAFNSTDACAVLLFSRGMTHNTKKNNNPGNETVDILTHTQGGPLLVANGVISRIVTPVIHLFQAIHRGQITPFTTGSA